MLNGQTFHAESLAVSHTLPIFASSPVGAGPVASPHDCDERRVLRGGINTSRKADDCDSKFGAKVNKIGRTAKQSARFFSFFFISLF